MRAKKLLRPCNLYAELREDFRQLYEKIVDKNLPIRQIAISLDNITRHSTIQLSLFADEENSKNQKIQEAMLDIKKRFGKNSILRANSLLKISTAINRNKMIGGHLG